MSLLSPVVVMICLLAAILPAQSAMAAQNTVDQTSLVLQDFSKRVDDYVHLRKRAQAGLASSKSGSAAHIKRDQEALAQKVRAERSQVSQGNIFNSEISTLFRKLIATPFESGQGGEIRASLRHAEPVHGLLLHVNGAYPQELALQSTPPTLLSDLPKLPPDIEYRIVGRELILLDTAANVIVDLLPDAVPQAPSQH